MKTFLIPKLHIKNQNIESQFSPKMALQGHQEESPDCGDRCVSQEVSNLANSHCQENHKATIAITKLTFEHHH